MSDPTLQAAAARMRQAFDLFEAGLSMQRARLRREHPDAAESEIQVFLVAWLSARAGAEYADAPGRVRRLDTGS